MDHRPAGFLYAAVQSRAYTRQNGNTQCGAFRIHGGSHGAVHHIRQHLTPQRALSAAAASQHRFGGNTHSGQHAQAVVQAVGNAFHNRTEQVPALMHSAQAEEDAAAVTVQMRSPFAHQVRRIDQLVGTDGALSRFLIGQFIGIHTHGFGGDLFSAAEVIPEPFQAQAGSLGNTHHMPGTGYCAAECMHTALGVDRQLIGMGKHYAACSDGRKSFAVFHNTGAHSSSRVVPRAADHQRIHAQSRQLRGFCGNVSGHLAALIHLGQQVLVDIQDAKQFIAPAAVRNIQHLHAAGIGNLCRKVACQHKADIVLGQQHMLAFCIVFRFMVPHPDQLGKGEARQCGIGRDPDQVIITDLGGNLFTFFGSALIAPDDGGTDDFVFFIQHHQAVHLSADTEGNNVFFRDAALCQYCTDGAHRGIIPVLGILLCPAVLRLIHRILHCCGADTLAVLVKQYCLRT